MSAPYPRRGNLLFVGMLLLVSVLVEQYAIAPFLPWIGELGGFRPMLVFLDIPLELPRIDWLPVSILFAIGYSIAIGPEMSRTGQRGALRKKVWQALTGWWFLLLLLLAGGAIYYAAQDYLPKQVGNGIDSFGLRADIILPWPYENLIHLHGSMLLLVFFLIGIFVLSRRSRQTGSAALTSGARLAAVAADPIATPIAESIATPIASTPPPAPQQPRPAPAKQELPSPVFPAEPAPTCRYTTPPPVAIIMPRPAIRRMHPCVVSGVVEPKRSRRTTNVLEPMNA